MIAKFTRLEFELFTRPSKFDFLRDHQLLNPGIFERFCSLFPELSVYSDHPADKAGGQGQADQNNQIRCKKSYNKCKGIILIISQH